jgi:hypothetical protein
MNMRVQALFREKEFIRSSIDLSSLNTVGEGTKLREMEELLQKKSKEIYDLTVMIGSLKEENHSLKKDQVEMIEDF